MRNVSELQSKEEEQQAASADAVFPVILQIMENCIFNAKDPIVLGCTIEEGIAKVHSPNGLSAPTAKTAFWESEQLFVSHGSYSLI